jgi:hypothetical protein
VRADWGCRLKRSLAIPHTAETFRTVADSVWFKGDDESGMSVSVSVCVAPTASETGARMPAVRPAGAVAASVTVSGTFPSFWSVSVVVAATPGALLSDAGALASDTASISGTVNDTFCVWVIDESDALVAVTVNESCVPGGGIGWPTFGCK